MQRRIISPASQAIYIVVAFATTLTTSIVVGTVTNNGTLGVITELVLTCASVIVAARLFRSPHESTQPREWWRLTHSSTSAWIWAGLFAVGALANFTTGGIGLLASAVGLLISAAFVNSALRTKALAAKAAVHGNE